MNKIDLHMHSIVSDDGEFEIQTLIDMAKENDIEIIAVADHNTSNAYLQDFDSKGIDVITAIELDCTFLDKDFHLLGYNIDPTAQVYADIYKKILEQEVAGSKYRLEYVRNVMKLKLNENILKLRNRNGMLVAEALCEAALAIEENKDNPYLKPYLPGGNRSDNPQVNFFWDYFAKGKEGYHPLYFITMEEAIQIFRSQNAEIVLAHPGNNVKEDKQLMDDIVALGIDGIEVYSSYHNDKQIAFYKDVCKKYGLLQTCGSDFHGRIKPTVKMGNCHMPKEEEAILHTYLMKNVLKK